MARASSRSSATRPARHVPRSLDQCKRVRARAQPDVPYDEGLARADALPEPVLRDVQDLGLLHWADPGVKRLAMLAGPQ